MKSMILAFAGYYSLTFLLNLSQNPIVVTVFLILLGLVATVAVWQLVVWIFETRTKNRKYREAQAFARARNKQLLVIGGPWGVQPFRRWLNKPAHAGGDVCLDISARALAGHICPVVASVTDIPFADKAFGAVFLSHVLEHLPTGEDARKALDDMDRVADGVFFVYPSRQSIAAWIITDHKLWIWEKNGQIHIRQRRSAHKKGNSVGKAGSQIH